MSSPHELKLLRDPSKVFPEAAIPTDILSLTVWYCKYSTLEPLKKFSSLTSLEIAGSPDATLLALAELSQLRRLRILHMPGVSDLSPLAKLSKLEILSLATLPSWDSSGKVSEISSLLPLANLKLKHLELFGVVPPDRSLRPVETINSLVTARFSKYPKKEIERFHRETKVRSEHNPE